jgi:hypothetical protein
MSLSLFPFNFKNNEFNKDKELHTFIITKTGLQLVIHGIKFTSGYETYPQTIKLSLLNIFTGLAEIGIVYGYRSMLDFLNTEEMKKQYRNSVPILIAVTTPFPVFALFYLNTISINNNDIFGDDFSRTMTIIENVLGHGGSAGVLIGVVATQLKEYGK